MDGCRVGRVPAAVGGVERPATATTMRDFWRGQGPASAPSPPGWPARRTCTPTTGARRTPRSTSSPPTTASPCATWWPTSASTTRPTARTTGTAPTTTGQNHGVEGETDDEEILALRRRIAANLMATLCLVQRRADDHCRRRAGRTQRGNNNAYCQDNEISWIDWRPDDAWLDVYEVTKTALLCVTSIPRCASGTGSRASRPCAAAPRTSPGCTPTAGR